VSVLADRLRGIIKAPSGADVVPRAAPAFIRSEGDLETLLDGRWFGHCFIVERRMAPAARYGRTTIGDLAARLHESAHEAPLVCTNAAARPPFVFFDLETTGLSGGAGSQAFLVGCGMFDEDGGFTTRQYLLARYSDERAMLAAVAEDFSRAGALVSFNGKSFDAPVLETRYLFHRLEWFASQQPHIDVLHPARRFWKEDECSLGVLEQQVLGASRQHDVQGFEIPDRYFRFVRSGDPKPLVDVLEHNRLDLVSLAGLTSRLLEIVRGGPDYADNAREALALGHVYAAAHAAERALGAYERAVTLATTSRSRRAPLVLADALRALAVAYRRARRFDEAARCWSALIDNGCSSVVEREAIEALAIHHEHRRRDLQSARVFALKNVACGDLARERWKETARRRLTRIERKLESAGSAGRLLDDIA
jgi:uncharacterized protein YprB with RNaseH-like and TPR domain